MTHKLIIVKKEIEHLLYFIRGNQVILDTDLAKIYQVETKAFNQAVKRNADRFPENFCFQLTQGEFDLINLRSQIVTLSLNHGGRRYLPYVFSEQGIELSAFTTKTYQTSSSKLSLLSYTALPASSFNRFVYFSFLNLFSIKQYPQ